MLVVYTQITSSLSWALSSQAYRWLFIFDNSSISCINYYINPLAIVIVIPSHSLIFCVVALREWESLQIHALFDHLCAWNTRLNQKQMFDALEPQYKHNGCGIWNLVKSQFAPLVKTPRIGVCCYLLWDHWKIKETCYMCIKHIKECRLGIVVLDDSTI